VFLSARPLGASEPLAKLYFYRLALSLSFSRLSRASSTYMVSVEQVSLAASVSALAARARSTCARFRCKPAFSSVLRTSLRDGERSKVCLGEKHCAQDRVPMSCR